MIRRPLCAVSLVCIFIIFLTLWIKGPPSVDLSEWTGRELLICGYVSGKESREDTQVLYLSNVAFCDVGSSVQEIPFQTPDKKSEYGLICYVEQELPAMGAVVLMTGEVSEFRRATNPGEFDLKKYYLRQGYCGKAEIHSILEVSEECDRLKEYLYRIRCYFTGVLETVMDEQDASVMGAMLLGEKSGMDRDIKKLYQANGIAHILAISGLHISIIGMGLYGCMKKLAFPGYVSAGTSVGFMIAYVIMTGESTSAIRAVVMFSFMVMASCVKRSYDLPTALAVAALCTVAAEPGVLFQTGFWMSYMAVFGVAVLHPAVIRDVEISGKKKRGICNAVSAGICVNLATLPVLLAGYYEYPVYSVFLNLIIIPLMSVLIVTGLLAMMAGCVFVPLGKAIAFPVHWILVLYRELCAAAMKLPCRSWIAGAPKSWQIILFYTVLLIVAAAGKKVGKKRLPKIKFHIRLLLIAASVLMLGIRLNPGLNVTFLDVGQGDGICIRTADMTCMIDGGSSSKNRLAEYQIEPFLKHEGIREIDYWFVTHPDRDHCSGLIELMEREENGIRIHALVLPEAYGISDSCGELIALAGERGVEIMYLSRGDCVQAGELKLTILHPQKGYYARDINQISLVAAVEYRDFRAVLTGDATAENEAEVIRYCEEQDSPLMGSRGITLLKAGHHGSSTSTSEDFLEFFRPRVAVVSCGLNNRYGHPHKEVLGRLEENGCAVFRTDECGAVTVKVRRGRVEIYEYLEN